MIQLRYCLIVLLTLVTAGCGALKSPAYSPDYQVLDNLKNKQLLNVSVAPVEPTDPEAKVNKISLRAASLTTDQGTFSAYFEQSMIQDLTEMGIYQPSSNVQIKATLVENNIDISSFSKGHGKMIVDLEIHKSSVLTFSKQYIGETEFESSFAGAVAIPKAQSEYPYLVRELLKQIYSDPEFIKELSK
ncbi:hypothetical protein [Amphritea pacifica]|uniref:Lipoprotein n=1 Tax=Amphritea pacifica TaxID=2811233 RepID=A0ABS2W4J9_9GAMM|nr:hypothetical protein [Amphritea pacifica]MBN0986642.1 hypothetical protein [Amphritea pacifica]